MAIKHKGFKEALTSLQISNPFFGSVLLQQNIEEVNDSEKCPTAQVNGKTYQYNPKFFDTLPFDETKGTHAHEAEHLVGLHHIRQGNRDGETWNESCDYAINANLTKAGFKLPKGALLDAQFDGKSEEDIYRILWREKQKQNPNQKPDPNGKMQPGAGGGLGQVSPAPKGTTAKQAQAQVERAMTIAKACGQKSADFDRAIQAMAARYDWKEILHRFFSDLCSSDYSFAQPNRRYIQSGFILPSLRSRALGKVCLAIDTSGSISLAEVSAMVNECLSCLDQYNESGGADNTLTVIYCDSAIKRVETLGNGDIPKPAGGGGTDFRPPFDYIDKEGLDGAALIYLTDGYCDSFPTVQPSYPVLWGLVIDNAGFKPPFGETFKLDIAS